MNEDDTLFGQISTERFYPLQNRQDSFVTNIPQNEVKPTKFSTTEPSYDNHVSFQCH